MQTKKVEDLKPGDVLEDGPKECSARENTRSVIREAYDIPVHRTEMYKKVRTVREARAARKYAYITMESLRVVKRPLGTVVQVSEDEPAEPEHNLGEALRRMQFDRDGIEYAYTESPGSDTYYYCGRVRNPQNGREESFRCKPLALLALLGELNLVRPIGDDGNS